MIWDFFGFIKKVLVNIGVHICWLAIYLSIDLIAFSSESRTIRKICFFSFDYKQSIFVIGIFIVYYLIQKIYSKNPCETILGKCIYWLLSIVQTLCISSILFGW